jgi:hypothetical protein
MTVLLILIVGDELDEEEADSGAAIVSTTPPAVGATVLKSILKPLPTAFFVASCRCIWLTVLVAAAISAASESCDADTAVVVEGVSVVPVLEDESVSLDFADFLLLGDDGFVSAVETVWLGGGVTFNFTSSPSKLLDELELVGMDVTAGVSGGAGLYLLRGPL